MQSNKWSGVDFAHLTSININTNNLGTLCGQCIQDYGPTFDLQFCDNNCGAAGIVLYIAVCEWINKQLLNLWYTGGWNK